MNGWENTHAPAPRTPQPNPAHGSHRAQFGPEGGREHFAVRIYLPLSRLTGIDTGTGKFPHPARMSSDALGIKSECASMWRGGAGERARGTEDGALITLCALIEVARTRQKMPEILAILL